MSHCKTRIKICGLTREQDVDAAVAAGADAIGFVFYPPSPRYVAPARAAELAQRIPPFVDVVGLFVFDFEASAFLHHMVRNLVGTLVYVGKGAQPAGWVDALLQMKDRKLAAPTFSPDGLYFRGPVYEAHWGLPEGGDEFLDGVLT